MWSCPPYLGRWRRPYSSSAVVGCSRAHEAGREGPTLMVPRVRLSCPVVLLRAGWRTAVAFIVGQKLASLPIEAPGSFEKGADVYMCSRICAFSSGCRYGDAWQCPCSHLHPVSWCCWMRAGLTISTSDPRCLSCFPPRTPPLASTAHHAHLVVSPSADTTPTIRSSHRHCCC